MQYDRHLLSYVKSCIQFKCEVLVRKKLQEEGGNKWQLDPNLRSMQI